MGHLVPVCIYATFNGSHLMDGSVTTETPHNKFAYKCTLILYITDLSNTQTRSWQIISKHLLGVPQPCSKVVWIGTATSVIWLSVLSRQFPDYKKVVKVHTALNSVTMYVIYEMKWRGEGGDEWLG